MLEEPNPLPVKTSGETAPRPYRACAKPPDAEAPDPALARIIRAWPELPEPIRRAMLALVESGK